MCFWKRVCDTETWRACFRREQVKNQNKTRKSKSEHRCPPSEPIFLLSLRPVPTRLCRTVLQKNINNKKMYLAGQTDKKRRIRRARLTRGRKGVCKPGRREIIFEKKTPTCVRPRDFQKLHLYTYFYLYMCKGRKRGKNKIKSRETRARDNIRDKSSIQAHVFRVVVIPRVK